VPISLLTGLALSESLNVVIFQICNMQNAYNPTPNDFNDIVRRPRSLGAFHVTDLSYKRHTVDNTTYTYLVTNSVNMASA
jgi:hypothetical protein